MRLTNNIYISKRKDIPGRFTPNSIVISEDSMEIFYYSKDGSRQDFEDSNKNFFSITDGFADGIQDDGPNIQSAINDVINSRNLNTLVIQKGTYRINTPLSINGEIKIIADDVTFIVDTSEAQFSLFTKTSDTDLTIEGLIVDASSASSANGVRFLDIQEDFTNSDITIDNCSFLTYDDEVSNIFIFIETDLEGNSVIINNCITDNCVFFYFDTTADFYLQKLVVTNNTATNCPRWFLRSQSFSPATSGYVVINAWVEGNTVTDINGTLVDTSQVARVVQVEVSDTLYIKNNIFDTSTTTGAGNAVYMGKGNLIFENNIVKDLQSVNTSAIIDDKGDDTATERWSIKNNHFDQSGLTHSDDVGQAIIRILGQNNVDISNNTFKGLKTLPLYVYQSVNNGEWAANVVFDSNVIYDIDYPCVVGLKQNMDRIKITNNVIHSITNSDTINHDGRTDPSLVVCYQTFNTSGEGITNVTIKGNTIHYCDSIFYMVRTWINAAAPDAIMDKIYIVNNTVHDAANFSALCFFVGGATINDMTNIVSANNVAIGLTEDQGLRPADVTQQNNIL